MILLVPPIRFLEVPLPWQSSSGRDILALSAPPLFGTGNASLPLNMQCKSMKRMAWIGLIVFLLGCEKPTLSSEFVALFSTMSIGVPEYLELQNFHQAADDVKGNFFAADLTLLPVEFTHFLEKLGISEGDALAPDGAVGVKVGSNANSEHTWILTVKVQGVAPEEKFYRLHVEGRQPY